MRIAVRYIKYIQKRYAIPKIIPPRRTHYNVGGFIH